MNSTLMKINNDMEMSLLSLGDALTAADLVFENYYDDVKGNVRLGNYESALNIALDRIRDERLVLETLNERLFQYAGTGEDKAKKPIFRNGVKA